MYARVSVSLIQEAVVRVCMHDFAIYKFSSLFLDYGAMFEQTPTLGAKFMFILQYSVHLSVYISIL